MGDDSPRLQGGGFWNDAGVSSHTVRSFHAQKRARLKTTSVSHGTANVWYASAFTQGSLPWNLQTLLSCQCAKELLTHSFERTQKWKVFLRLRAAHLSS